jgi:hypothetical protein
LYPKLLVASNERAVNLYDTSFAVAIDQSDSAWIVGLAKTASVPTTPNAIEPVGPVGAGEIGGIGYALKLSASGDVLYGTYLGTNLDTVDHNVESVAIDTEGRPYFALNFPSATSGPGAECRTAAATIMALSANGATVLSTSNLLSSVRKIALDGTGGFTPPGTRRTRHF